MLAGRQAFQGETSAEVLASVLVRDPDFKLLPQDLNPRLYDLLRRCLEKNLKRRWHAVADLRIELESIAADIYRKGETAQALAPPQRSREKLAWKIAAAAILMAMSVKDWMAFSIFVWRSSGVMAVSVYRADLQSSSIPKARNRPVYETHLERYSAFRFRLCYSFSVHIPVPTLHCVTAGRRDVFGSPTRVKFP